MKNKLFFYIKNFYFIAPIIFYFGERSLVAYDEGIYALQAKWILENNNWITPMKWGAVVDLSAGGIDAIETECVDRTSRTVAPGRGHEKLTA